MNTSLPEEAEAEVVELGQRRVLADRERQLLRNQAWREVVDRVLIVALREQEHARLPLQRGAVREPQRRIVRRRDAHFLRELEVLFRVVARDGGSGE